MPPLIEVLHAFTGPARVNDFASRKRGPYTSSLSWPLYGLQAVMWTVSAPQPLAALRAAGPVVSRNHVSAYAMEEKRAVRPAGSKLQSATLSFHMRVRQVGTKALLQKRPVHIMSHLGGPAGQGTQKTIMLCIENTAVPNCGIACTATAGSPTWTS